MSKRTSKLGHDENLKYFANSCVNQGKTKSKATNALKLRQNNNNNNNNKIK